MDSLKLVKFSLYIMVCMYTFSYYQITSLYQPLASLKWLSLMLMIIVLTIVFRKQNFFKKSQKLNLNISISSFFVVFTMISFFNSKNILGSVATLIILLISCLCIGMLNSTKLKIITINRMFYSGIITIIVISMVFSLKEYSLFMNVFTDSERFRISGLFKHPNNLAGNCFLGIILLFETISLSSKVKKKKYLPLNIFLILILFFNLIVSNSRTGLICLIVFFLNYMYLIRIRKKKIYLQTYALGISYFIGIMLLVKLFLSTRLNDNTNSLSVRMTGWKEVYLNMINDPFILIFGHGLSSTSGYISGNLQQIGAATDNSYIIIFYQLGLLGIGIIVALIINLLIKNFQYNINKNINTFSFNCSFIMSFLVYCLFENYFLAVGNLMTLYFWFRMHRLTLHQGKESM